MSSRPYYAKRDNRLSMNRYLDRAQVQLSAWPESLELKPGDRVMLKAQPVYHGQQQPPKFGTVGFKAYNLGVSGYGVHVDLDDQTGVFPTTTLIKLERITIHQLRKGMTFVQEVGICKRPCVMLSRRVHPHDVQRRILFIDCPELRAAFHAPFFATEYCYIVPAPAAV